jgi:hypothetical protein
VETLTRIQGAVVEAVELYGKLASLLGEMRKELSSPEEVVQQLRDDLAQPDPNSLVGKLLTSLGVDVGPVREFLEKNKDNIDAVLALFQPLRSFGTHALSYPLAASGAPGAVLTVEGSAELAATLEADTDGRLLEGVTFEKDRTAFVHLGVMGTVKGSAAGAAPIGKVGVQGAFEAGATISVDNFFRHAADERTLAALAADIPLFTLPGRIGNGASLRSASGPDGLRIPGQYVRLGGSGSIRIGGSLSYSQSLLSSVAVSGGSLNLDRSLEVLTGVSAELDFDYRLEGIFDLVVTTSPDSASRVRVQLSKQRSSVQSIGFQVGVDVGIRGVDLLGKALLDRFLPDVEPLIQKIEEEADTLSDLRGLFQAKLEDEIESLLARQTVTNQIETFLGMVQVHTDLKAKLKKLAVDAALGFTGDQLDALQQNFPPVVQGFKNLIRKYRTAVDRLNKALKKAADIRIGILFSRTREAMEKEDVNLEIDIDPQQERDLYLRILQGDFAAAVAAQENGADVKIVKSLFHQAGELTRTQSLNVTALGFTFSQASILRQIYDLKVSATGEVTLGEKTTFEASTRTWRNARTVTFLANSQVIALLLDRNGLITDPRFDHRIELQVAHETAPRLDRNVLDEQARLAALRVLSPSAPLVKDLVFEEQATAAKRKFGTLTFSAVLDFGKDDLDALLAASEDEAKREFIRGLAAFFDFPQEDALDEAGVPFLLWQEVQAFGTGPFESTGLQGSKLFTQGDTRHKVDRDELPRLHLAVQLLNGFSRSFVELRALRNAAPVAGETVDGLQRRIQAFQGRLAQRLSWYLAPPLLLDRHKVGQALFLTLLRLARAHGGHPEAYASIQRKEDEKVFVYTPG